MELVYLWVEAYKNIHNQGFNFSPKFNCNYDPENKELTIKDNPNYIENFFGDNINVTAIIGKNGSGKSSLINALINSNEKSFPNGTNYILIAYDGSKICQETNMENLEPNIENIGYLNLKVMVDRQNNDKNIIMVGGGSQRNFFKRHDLLDISKQQIVNLMTVELGKEKSDFQLSSFMYLPNKISVKLKDDYNLIDENINFLHTQDERKKFSDIFKNLSDGYHKVLLIEYIRKGYRNIEIDNFDNKEALENALVDKKDDLEKISNLIFYPLKDKLISELTENDKNLYIRKNGYFHFLTIDLIDDKGRKFNDLSHGEQNIFGQLLNIYFYSNHNDKSIFLFDEPEIALHPTWQKKYLHEIMMCLKNIQHSVQFIFTSHSPFLLSDIPKHNIIFLDTYEDGKCKVLKHDEVMSKKQTFGANIHTLLSDSFFMEDGLMGEFAKGKIQQIMNLLNGKPSSYDYKFRYIFTNVYHFDLMSKNIKKVIDAIGEPFLRDKLLKMHEEKYPQTNEEKIKDLEAEIERIRSGKNQLQS